MYLTLDHLSKRFPGRGKEAEVAAVDDVSLAIEKGELVTLLGPSGFGKTTTLRLIAGFEFPTQGRIVLDGRGLNDVSPNRRYGHGLPELRDFPAPHRLREHRVRVEGQKTPLVGHPAQDRRGAELNRARRPGAPPPPSTLPRTATACRARPRPRHGAQGPAVRRAAVEPGCQTARADARGDSPHPADARHHQRYVTHDQAEAMTLSDRIVVMNKGRIAQIGTAHRIYRRPANEFVADFIGKANFLPAQVVGVAPDRLDLDVLGRRLSIQPSDVPLQVGERGTLLARPEAITVDLSGDGYPGRVPRVAYLCPVVEYEVQVPGVAVMAAPILWSTCNPTLITAQPGAMLHLQCKWMVELEVKASARRYS